MGDYCGIGQKLLKLKVLETDHWKSLKAFPERTTKGSLMKSKQFETEMARSLHRILAAFKYDSDKISAVLKTSLSEPVLCNA